MKRSDFTDAEWSKLTRIINVYLKKYRMFAMNKEQNQFNPRAYSSLQGISGQAQE